MNWRKEIKMIKIVIELEHKENTLIVNARCIDKYASDDVEKEIGKQYFNILKKDLKNIDGNRVVKEIKKKDCKKSLDDLIDLMFNNNEITSKVLNEEEFDKLVDEILNNDEELKNCGKETIKKILDEIMEED